MGKPKGHDMSRYWRLVSIDGGRVTHATDEIRARIAADYAHQCPECTNAKEKPCP